MHVLVPSHGKAREELQTVDYVPVLPTSFI